VPASAQLSRLAMPLENLPPILSWQGAQNSGPTNQLGHFSARINAMEPRFGNYLRR